MEKLLHDLFDALFICSVLGVLGGIMLAKWRNKL